MALLAVAPAPTRLPPHLASAAADPARGQDRQADERRKGPEILAFAELRPGARVIDLIPGGAYWTRLLARAVGPRGRVHGIWPLPYAKVDRANVEKYRMMAGSKDYPNVTLSIQPAASVAAPEAVDLVFTAQNYHDYPDPFMGSIDPATFNKAVFGALKPCGTFVVIDHAAEVGSGMRDIGKLHRIDPQTVRAQVTAAGFRFVAASSLLANPEDDRGRSVFDEGVRGRTDQFIYRFQKPCGAGGRVP
ncbi:MAG TPA: methyltransferase [Allosphingosinicella sp.]|jgi:predicted methyltransferase